MTIARYPTERKEKAVGKKSITEELRDHLIVWRQKCPVFKPRPGIRLRSDPHCPIAGMAIARLGNGECEKRCGQQFWNDETCSPIRCLSSKRLCNSCVRQREEAMRTGTGNQKAYVVSGPDSILCAGHEQYGADSRCSDWH